MRIKFLLRWSMLEALSTSRNLEKQYSVKNAIRAQPQAGLFWTNLHEILAPFLKLNEHLIFYFSLLRRSDGEFAGGVYGDGAYYTL